MSIQIEVLICKIFVNIYTRFFIDGHEYISIKFL